MTSPLRGGRTPVAGAAGAWAVALLSIVSTAVALMRVMHDLGAHGPPVRDGAVHALVLEGAAVAIATGLAQFVAVAGARRALPGFRVGDWGAVAGWFGAALLVAAGALAVAAEASQGRPPILALRLAEFAPVFTGAWALAVVAVAWRLKRWATWLRVTGAVFGAAAMMEPAIPPLGALVLLTGLVWWGGLGAVLLKSARSTSS